MKSFSKFGNIDVQPACLEDGPGGDHDDEGEGDGGEGPHQAGQDVRLHRESDWSPGCLAAQQHWESSAEGRPVKHPVN